MFYAQATYVIFDHCDTHDEIQVVEKNFDSIMEILNFLSVTNSILSFSDSRVNVMMQGLLTVSWGVFYLVQTSLEIMFPSLAKLISDWFAIGSFVSYNLWMQVNQLKFWQKGF